MTAGWRLRAVAITVGLGLDRLIGDPPDVLHPVAWFGRGMARLEGRSWKDGRSAGVIHLVIGSLSAGTVAWAFRALARRTAGRTGEVVAGAMVTATVVGARSLDRRAVEIERALLAGRLDDARSMLPALVGRDPSGLDEGEIARAVVESVAENSVDAVVAPVFWAVVVGPVGAAVYRAVNTLDAMVGHRNPRYLRFGWASARADDLANYLPARIAAAIVAVLSPGRLRQVVGAVHGQSPAHPSPNAGMIEAAFAAALGVRLGGVNNYGGVLEERAALGSGRPPEAGDIVRARALARRLYVAVTVCLAAPAAARLAALVAQTAQSYHDKERP